MIFLFCNITVIENYIYCSQQWQKHSLYHISNSFVNVLLLFPDPSWSSVNRGVTVCDECCSVHRSLGRHISQIKSLKKASWSPTSLAVSNNTTDSVGIPGSSSAFYLYL